MMSNLTEIAKENGAQDTLSGKLVITHDQLQATVEQVCKPLIDALEEARRAIGDHYAPNDCYATGPMTGDVIRDLIQCPACSAINMYASAIEAHNKLMGQE
jgi:hypothetical protein